jgi:hypothetical protein
LPFFLFAQRPPAVRYTVRLFRFGTIPHSLGGEMLCTAVQKIIFRGFGAKNHITSGILLNVRPKPAASRFRLFHFFVAPRFIGAIIAFLVF